MSSRECKTNGTLGYYTKGFEHPETVERTGSLVHDCCGQRFEVCD